TASPRQSRRANFPVEIMRPITAGLSGRSLSKSARRGTGGAFNRELSFPAAFARLSAGKNLRGDLLRARQRRGKRGAHAALMDRAGGIGNLPPIEFHVCGAGGAIPLPFKQQSSAGSAECK